MYETLGSSKRRWGGYSEIIDYWLTLRQKLLVHYSIVAGLNNINKRSLPSEDELSAFCASLIDYISAGHFRIYNKVMERWKENGMAATNETDRLYFKIVETTQPLVKFNDKYTDPKIINSQFEKFDSDVSSVGQLMERRFNLEDKLIQLIADSVKN